MTTLRQFIRRWWWPSLWEQIGILDECHMTACRDWSEDHTHIQNLCRKAGCTEHQVEGDSYGVPGIQDLADVLASKIATPEERTVIEAAKSYVNGVGIGFTKGYLDLEKAVQKLNQAKNLCPKRKVDRRL